MSGVARMPQMRSSAFVCALVVASCCCTPARNATLSSAAPRPVEDNYFGQRVIDPYRWMETSSKETTDWFTAEDRRARTTLASYPIAADVLREVRAAVTDAETIEDGRWAGDRVFHLGKRKGTKAYSVETGALPGATAAAFAWKPDGEGDTIDFLSPSPSGRTLAVGISIDGSQESVLRVIDTSTGQLATEFIPGARDANVSWLDERSFVYTRYIGGDAADASSRLRPVVFRHVLGDKPGRDAVVLSTSVLNADWLAPDDLPSVRAIHGSGFALAVVYHGVQRELSVRVKSEAQLLDVAAPWTELAAPDDKVIDVTARDGEVFFLTHDRSSTLRLVSRSVRGGPLREVLPPSDLVLQQVVAARDALYVHALDRGYGRVLRVRGAEVTSLSLPFEASVRALQAHADADGIVFALEGWAHSQRWYRFDPKNGDVTPLGLERDPVDWPDVETTRLEARSHDGVVVPLSVVERKGTPHDGTRRLWLTAYGAGGLAISPVFIPAWRVWLDHGGIIAIAHVRGGGEKGSDWHAAGRMDKKENSTRDVIACAEHLIANGYTSSKSLGVYGQSAGAIPIGGALNARPDLFGAAVVHAGAFNILRIEQTPAGPHNVKEFGSVATAAGARSLIAMDPYTHVRDGASYPAILLTAGERDSQVPPWQVAKMAIRLQAATSSAQPILFRLLEHQGHGANASADADVARYAAYYTFMLTQLGGGVDTGRARADR